MRIYHYTTIDTLALILKNRTLRFNRLDNLDDLKECVKDKTGYNIGQYVFVSCWTDNPTERIALWKLYTQGVGVIISMEHDMFQEYVFVGDGKRLIGSMKGILPMDDILGTRKDYFILPIGTSESSKENFFFRRVEYVPDFEARTQNLISQTNGEVHMSLGEVGKYKSDIWSFQDEVRFALAIFPKDKNFDIIDPGQPGQIVNHVLKNQPLNIDHYDMSLSAKALDSMEVTLYPGCSESHKTIVKALLKVYAPNAKLKTSEMEGQVRLK